MSSLYNDDRDSDIIMPTEATSSQTPRQSTFTAAVAGNSLVNTVAPALLQQPSAPFTNSISELLEHSEMPGGNRRTGYADYYRRLRAEAQVLPDYSRQYQPLLDAEIINSSYRSLENINTFFVPSYLRGSRYAHKYEEVHRERAAKIRMMENSKGHTKNNSESLGHNRNSSNVSLKSRTHHGVAHDIVENPPPPFPTNPAPLPTRLNKDDKHRDLIYLNELEVKFLASSGPHRNDSEKGLEAFAIRADHPAPRQAGLYYYEVIIMTSNLHKYIFPPLSSSKVMENLLLTDKRSPMAIGFAGEKVALNRPPGWEPDSYAYHGDDGNAYASNTRGEKYRGTYGAQGEVIGCGINFSTMKIFYTKNGNLLGKLGIGRGSFRFFGCALMEHRLT